MANLLRRSNGNSCGIEVEIKIKFTYQLKMVKLAMENGIKKKRLLLRVFSVILKVNHFPILFFHFLFSGMENWNGRNDQTFHSMDNMEQGL